jgi:type II secretory pathway component PulK
MLAAIKRKLPHEKPGRGLFRVLGRRFRARRRRDRQSGVALLVTISALSMLIALVSQFSYGTMVDAAQAANARDELRAHYLARSAMELSRMLIKIQLKFVEPIMNAAQQMLSKMADGQDLGISLRVTDYTGPLLGFFNGNKGDVAMLSGLVGIDTTQAKGLSAVQGHMDAEITNEDGKIDINCGGGPTSDRTKEAFVFRLLMALFMSPRYDLLFSTPDADGRIVDRADLARAIIDWADRDEQAFAIDANAAGAEDYRYDQGPEPYLAHNDRYDSIGEVNLVRGMTADFAEAFVPYFTIYASNNSCKVNLKSIKGDCTPLIVGLIRAALIPDPTKPPQDLTILDDTKIYPLASVLCERGTAVGFDSLATVVKVLSDPAGSLSKDDPRFQMMQNFTGITITQQQLAQVATVDPPRVYRVVATGESGKVKKRITAILDTKGTLLNPVTDDAVSEQAAGIIRYWREE